MVKLNSEDAVVSHDVENHGDVPEETVEKEGFEVVSLGKVTATTFGGGRVFEDNGVINSRTT
jgi:hypothetical protein